MKELSIEEKAKRYDEALKVANKYKDTYIMFPSIKEEVFPELKESDDERIRKELLNYLYDVHDDDEERARWIAYLEKQDEQKPADKIQLGKKYKCTASPRYSMFMIGEIYEAKDKFLCSFMNLCSDCFEPIEDNKQNPAWSKEDEMFVHGLIRGLSAKRDIHGHTTFSSDCIDITETINWLKSLKDRVQPKQEWSEEDEDILSSIIKDLVHPWNEYIPDRIEEEIKWLKNKLKSLRPQNRWKPSDEQMKVLNTISSKEILSGYERGMLIGLYTELQKLK